MVQTAFVGRFEELKQLDQRLDLVIDEKRLQLVFVAGIAGEGKTTLAEYFVNRELTRRLQTPIVAAIGRCNQQTSIAEAYLPFREIIGQLSGAKPTMLNVALNPDVTVWSKSILSSVGKALKEYGPDLLSMFVPGAALPVRAVVSAMDAGRQNYAQAQAERPGVEFKKVCEQFTNTLAHFTKEHPTVIILDDFQWADDLSIRLFDHLRKSLKASCVFFLVTYRTDELDVERDGKPHPLKKLIPTAKEESDAIVITLDSTNDAQVSVFVEHLLVAMSVEADEEFVKGLLNRTNGHPLLTVETIRYLQDAKHLVADESERWHIVPDFRWEKLPTQLDKVENLMERGSTSSISNSAKS